APPRAPAAPTPPPAGPRSTPRRRSFHPALQKAAKCGRLARLRRIEPSKQPPRGHAASPEGYYWGRCTTTPATSPFAEHPHQLALVDEDRAVAARLHRLARGGSGVGDQQVIQLLAHAADHSPAGALDELDQLLARAAVGAGDA